MLTLMLISWFMLFNFVQFWWHLIAGGKGLGMPSGMGMGGMGGMPPGPGGLGGGMGMGGMGWGLRRNLTKPGLNRVFWILWMIRPASFVNTKCFVRWFEHVTWRMRTRGPGMGPGLGKGGMGPMPAGQSTKIPRWFESIFRWNMVGLWRLV